MNTEIKAGDVVVTVGPHGKPNTHSGRIGSGKVAGIHYGHDAVTNTSRLFAEVQFASGFWGVWPVDQLRLA